MVKVRVRHLSAAKGKLRMVPVGGVLDRAPYKMELGRGLERGTSGHDRYTMDMIGCCIFDIFLSRVRDGNSGLESCW